MCEYPRLMHGECVKVYIKVDLKSAYIQRKTFYFAVHADPRAVSLIRWMTVVMHAPKVLSLLCLIFGQRVKHFGGHVAKCT